MRGKIGFPLSPYIRPCIWFRLLEKGLISQFSSDGFDIRGVSVPCWGLSCVRLRITRRIMFRFGWSLAHIGQQGANKKNGAVHCIQRRLTAIIQRHKTSEMLLPFIRVAEWPSGVRRSVARSGWVQKQTSQKWGFGIGKRMFYDPQVGTFVHRGY